MVANIDKKTTVDKAMEHFSLIHQDSQSSDLIPFESYLKRVTESPDRAIRNVFQVSTT